MKSSRDRNKARNFVSKIIEVSKKLGKKIQNPKAVELSDDRVGTYTHAIKSSIDPGKTQLVVCIFPTSRDDRYNAFKRLCCVDNPVASQVTISRIIPDPSKAGKLRSVVMKIPMQINCKLGGQLWTCDIPMNDLMICGIDVHHDPFPVGQSVAALVVSTNKGMTQWFSIPLVQGKGQENNGCFTTVFCSSY